MKPVLRNTLVSLLIVGFLLGAAVPGGLIADNEVDLTATVISHGPPVLHFGAVNPETGFADTDFTYSVVYTDADNNAPTSIVVYIDEVSHGMLPQAGGDGDYTNGETFEYTTSGLVKDIEHTFRFAASDAPDAAHNATDDIEEHAGPVVENSPPQVGSVSITPDPAYTDSDLTGVPSGWQDPDVADIPGYQWQWQKRNGTWEDIPGATTDTLDSSNFEMGNELKVLCTPFDGAATGGSVEATITISGAPEVQITSPEDGHATTDATITVEGNAEATPALTEATLTVNGVSRNINVTNGAFTVNNVSLALRENTITASVSNIVGTDSDTITVIRHCVPVVSITSPSTNSIFQNPVIRVNGTVNAYPAADQATIIVNEGGDDESNTLADVIEGQFSQEVNLPIEGQNTIRVTATNDAGTGTSSIVTVTLNSQAPAVTIITPASGLETNIADINVTGTVVDDTPLAEARLIVNGVSRTIDVIDDAFEEPITLINGRNTIKVTATDGLNTGSSTVTVILDTVPPVVSITSPPNNYITSTDTITITGTIDDQAITQATLRLNGADTPIDVSAGAFSHQVNLQNNRNTVSVSATDGAGNTGTSGSIVITYDDTKPTVTITSPASGHTTGNARLTVTGTVDSNTPITSSNLWLDGTRIPITVTAGKFSKTVTLSPGVNTIEVRVDDSAEPPNTGTSGIITVNLDKKAPVITINRPRDGLLLGTTSVTISGTIDDLAITQATLRLNGNETFIDVTAGAFSVDRNLVQGTNTILVLATDAYGNKGTSGTVVIKVDITKPTVNVNTPPTNTVTTATSIPVSGVVEHGQPVIDMTLTLNGVESPLDFWETASWEFGTTVNLARGKNTIVVRATDNLDHTGSSGVIYVTRDDTPPDITITSPVDGSYTNNENVEVTGTIDDPGVTTAILRVNGAPEVIPVQGGRFSRTVTINPGANTIQLSATDGVGNTGNSPIKTVTLDTTIPDVSITEPEENHRTNNTSLDVFATVDHGILVESVTLSLNGAPGEEMALNGDTYFKNVSLSAANNGANTLEVVATDNLGNAGTSGELTVTLDTTRPQLVVSLSDPTDTVLITVTSNEALQGAPVVDIEGNVDMTLVDTNKWTGEYPATGVLPDGSYAATITGTDRAGNQSTRTATFCKETVTTDNQSFEVNTETTSIQGQTNNDVTDASISVTQHIGNPTENTETGAVEAGVFVEVVASGELRDSVANVRIEVSYDPAEMAARDIDENTLKLYLWNVETGQWEVVEDSGVDTVNHIIWGNVDHLSTFGSFGESIPLPPSTPEEPTGGGGEGGGGGGGGAETPGTILLFDIITNDGMFTIGVVNISGDEACILTIPRGTICLRSNGQLPYRLTIIDVDVPPAAPPNSAIIGKVYELGPNGLTFNPPVFLTITYDPATLPQGVSEYNMVIAWWDEDTGEWIVLEGCSVDPVSHTITVPISHYTKFAILAYTRPAAFTVRDLSIIPDQVNVGEEVIVSCIVTNSGDLSDIYQAILKVNGVVIATREIGLAGGFSQQLDFPITINTPGIQTVTLDGLSGTFETRAPAAFTVSDLDISPEHADMGEEVTISAVVTNTGDVFGQYDAILNVNNITTTTRDITLAGGESQKVTFTTARGVPGRYTVTIADLSGTFYIRTPAVFTVSDLDIYPAEVNIGEEITVRAVITNAGEAAGGYKAILNLDGNPVDAKEITLAGGESQTVTFTATGDVPGTYTVTVADQSGTFTVLAPTVVTPEAINWPLIGGIIAAVIVLGLLAYLLVFRRRVS